MATRLVFNRKAFRQILTDPGVVADMQRRAEAIAEAAGEGYVAAVTENPHTRARAAVIAASPEAAADNAANNTLLRSLDAGR